MALATMCIPILQNPFDRTPNLPRPPYHFESEAEHEPAEKVAVKPATNGTALHMVRDILTPTPDVAPVPDVESKVPAANAVQETVVLLPQKAVVAQSRH